MCPIQERRERADFMREWRRHQPARIQTFLPRLTAREIRRELDIMPANLFPGSQTGDEDRFECALIQALLAKGVTPYRVLRQNENLRDPENLGF
jgi:hypothetical protein